MKKKFIESNGIKLHYLEKNKNLKPVLILLHGLSANANSFESYINLIQDYRVISVDLRGRGLSDKPNSGYTINEHVLDIIGLMDSLKIDNAILAGHSFGGLLTIYLATHFSNRVSKIVLIDVAAKMNPNLKEMVTPSATGRLFKSWECYNEYLNDMKKTPFLKGEWSSEIETFYKADCIETKRGIEPRSKVAHIQQAIEAVLDSNNNWELLISQIKQPTIVINALDTFINDQYIVSKKNATETVNIISNCKLVLVEGNHVTMLFGKGAKQTVDAINKFIIN